MGVSPWGVDSIVHGFFPLFVQQTGADQGLGHAVRVAVGRWTAVLEVTLLLLADAAGDADAGATVGHACREFVDVGGFVATGEAAGIVEPPLGVVGTDVVTVPLPKLLDGILNGPENRGGIFTLETEHEGSNSSWTLVLTSIRPLPSSPWC